MFSWVRRRVTWVNVAMTLALVFAMTGGAYAAKRYLITSTKQISPKVLKKLEGRVGPAGKAGPAGASGAIGPVGPAGPEGKAGLNGKDGTNGVNGSDGVNGKSVKSSEFTGKKGTCATGGSEFEVEGSAEITYACNGAGGSAEGTETGTWFIERNVSGAGEIVQTPVSFPTPLPQPATKGQAAHFEYVNQKCTEFPTNCGTPPGTTHCKGNFQEPTAEPGYFCVYSLEDFQNDIEAPTVLNYESVKESFAGFVSRYGAVLRFTSKEPAAKIAFGGGTWAVTPS